MPEYKRIGGERWELYADYLPSEGGIRKAKRVKKMLISIGYRVRVQTRAGVDLRGRRMVHYQVYRRKR